jgi:hypothetical protein
MDPGNSVVSNTARTTLLLNDEPLPWTERAAEFRSALPEPIKRLVEELSATSSGSDHKQSIRERLKQIMDLFKLTCYRPAKTGTINSDSWEHYSRGACLCARLLPSNAAACVIALLTGDYLLAVHFQDSRDFCATGFQDGRCEHAAVLPQAIQKHQIQGCGTIQDSRVENANSKCGRAVRIHCDRSAEGLVIDGTIQASGLSPNEISRRIHGESANKYDESRNAGWWQEDGPAGGESPISRRGGV